MTTTPDTNPHPKTRKVTVRMTERGYERLRRRAVDDDIKLSHLIRRMLAYADEKMPAGYVPGRRRAEPTPPPRR